MTKILFLAANPNDQTQLNFYKEIVEVRSAVDDGEFADQFKFKTKWSVKGREIYELLRIHKPDILHFSGHGSEDAELIFEDEHGKSQPVSEKSITTIFEHLKGNIKCVVLNGCYTESQANEIAKHIDCVVGTVSKITDQEAIEFSRKFYRQIADGDSVATAYEMGCIHDRGMKNQVKLANPNADASKIKFVQGIPTSSGKSGNTTRVVFTVIGIALLIAGIIIGYFLALGRTMPSLISTSAPTSVTVPAPFSTTTPTAMPTIASTSRITDTTTMVPANTATLFTDDFEANLNNWQGSNISISPTLVSSGYGNSKFAVEVVGDKATSSIYRPLPGDFSSHNSYKVSIWCKAKVRAPCALSWEDRPGYENSAEQTIAGNEEWQPLSICKTLTQNETGNMLVYLHAQAIKEFPVNRVQYDNLQVEQVSHCVRPISTGATLTWTSDFEEDLEIWKKCGDEKDRNVSALVQPGYNSDHAVQVTYRQQVDGQRVDQVGICRYVYDPNPSDPPSFKKGEFYRASVWCKAELSDECWLGFTNLPYDDEGYQNRAEEVIKGNGGWQLLSVCKAIFKDSQMSVHIYAKKRSTYSILYDDLQVEKVDRCP